MDEAREEGGKSPRSYKNLTTETGRGEETEEEGRVKERK